MSTCHFNFTRASALAAAIATVLASASVRADDAADTGDAGTTNKAGNKGDQKLETIFVSASPITNDPNQMGDDRRQRESPPDPSAGRRDARRRAWQHPGGDRHGIRRRREPACHSRLRCATRARARRRNLHLRRLGRRSRPRRARRSAFGAAYRDRARRIDAALRQPGHRRRRERDQQSRPARSCPTDRFPGNSPPVTRDNADARQGSLLLDGVPVSSRSTRTASHATPTTTTSRAAR